MKLSDREGGVCGLAGPETRSGRQFFFLLKLAAVLLFAGCSHPEPGADLVIINGAEPESLDTAGLTGEADGRVALEWFAGSTRYDPTHATPVPEPAQGG